jgi:hypothetical protein
MLMGKEKLNEWLSMDEASKYHNIYRFIMMPDEKGEKCRE